MLPQGADLNYFCTIAKAKNISRAAEILGLSQPSLSLAIRRLENFAQAELFVRNKNGVELTRAGKVFLDRAQILLEHWSTLTDDIKKDSKHLSGRYKIGAHVSVAIGNLNKVLAQLISAYPNWEFSFIHGLSRILTDQVIAFELDFAIVVNPANHLDLVIKELYRDEVTFFTNQKNFSIKVL
jgi:DNA-binding transcriptional LysR family regulator